ncbi:hypothetical protein D3C72_1639940 [compost metagenome]
MKSIVTVGPKAGFLSIDIDPGFAHCTIKFQYHAFIDGIELWNIKFGTIPPHPHIRQTASPARFYRCLFLSILCHCNILQIV